MNEEIEALERIADNIELLTNAIREELYDEIENVKDALLDVRDCLERIEDLTKKGKGN